MYNIRYTDAAVFDFDLIFNYIALENQSAAIKLLSKIETNILKLKDMPLLGIALPPGDYAVAEFGYRYLVVHPYIIFYRVRNDVVIIGRLLHSGQNWLRVLFEPTSERF